MEDEKVNEGQKKLNTVLEEPMSVSLSVLLNNGSKQGKVQTVSVGLGSLDVDEWDAQKAANIVNVLEDCLSKQIYSVQKTEKSVLIGH